eukprot:jgi/Galph1/5376/GphlegSOOS_G4024.1
MSHFIFYVERLAGVELVITGDKLIQGESAVVVCNHQSWTDSLLLYSLARQVGRQGDVKFFAKRSLAFFPFYGIAAILVRVCIFITRHMDRDRKVFQRLFSYLTDPNGQWPFWLIIFCEGTRFSEKKREKSQEYAKKHDLPVLQHVLLPKIGGFVSSVSSLKGTIHACYDFTIGYVSHCDQPRPSISDILFGHRFGRRKWIIHVHQRHIPISEIGTNDEEMKDFIYKLYKEKDRQLETFYSTGSFSGSSIPFHKISLVDLKQYRTSVKLKLHRRIHTGERPYVCNQPGCGKTFTRSDHLRRHQWSHQETKPFACNFTGCDKTFATKQRLDRHLATHSNSGKFSCPVPECNKTFLKKKKLSEHCWSHHMDELSNSVLFQNNLQPVHSNSVQISVLEEGWASWLKEESLQPKGESHVEYFCKTANCYQSFKKLADYHRHRSRMHGQSQWKCCECSRTFAKFSRWVKHMVTHEESLETRRVFACSYPYCEKKFTTAYNAMVHETAVHKKYRPFQCNLCSKQFTLRASYQRHVAKLHSYGDKDWKHSSRHMILKEPKQPCKVNLLNSLCGVSSA